MSEKKFLRIKSFSQEDINALFDEICKQIIDKNAEWVKKEILSFKDLNENPTIQDIIDLIITYDIESSFTLEVNWIDHVVKDKKEEEPVSTASDHRRLMNEERSQITNPDLQKVLATDEAVRRIDPNSIPNFM